MFRWTLALDLRRNGQVASGNMAVAVENRAYVFNLSLFEPQIDVHVFNTVSLRWISLPPLTTGGDKAVPKEWDGYTASLIDQTAYIWGLGCPQCTDILHAFDVATHAWSKRRVSGCVPQARFDHSACVQGKLIYVHGGRYCDLNWCANDVHALDTSTMICCEINARGTAPPSKGHSATIIGTKMFVFGGCGDQWDGYFNDLREFDTVTNRWRSKTLSAQPFPEKRGYHKAFAYNGELYVIGGQNSDVARLGIMWKFNTVTSSWKKVNIRVPSFERRMGCCVLGDQVVIVDNSLRVLDLSPRLKTLCKLAVIQYRLDRSELPGDVIWELDCLLADVTRGHVPEWKMVTGRRRRREGQLSSELTSALRQYLMAIERDTNPPMF